MSGAIVGVWALVALRVVLGLCLLAFCAYAGIAVWAARKWNRAQKPLDPDWTPAVTLLKPVRGVDAEAYDNFVSFCRQDYPADRYQLLFGALDPADPALELARRVQSEFPHLDIGVLGGSSPLQGPNLKVCNLAALLPNAKHDLLVLCDSDMRVTPDYLRRIVAPFGQGVQVFRCSGIQDTPNGGNREQGKTEGEKGRKGEGETQLPNYPTTQLPNTQHPTPEHLNTWTPGHRPVGLVTCPYRGYRAGSFAAVLEALGIGADFIPSALVSRALEGVGFAFGSTIVLPRGVLEELGGFEALAEELADDFRLGEGARRLGYEVVLSDYVVNDVLGKERFGAMWARRLRWARTVRACRPRGYAGAIVTHGTALGLLLLFVSGFAPYGWAALGAVLAARLCTAFLIACCSTRDPNVVRFLSLLPVSDLLSFALYVASYCGNSIVWRGERFRLLPGGKLTRADAPRSKRKVALKL